MDTIKEFIKHAFAALKRLFVKVLHGIMNFMTHVVAWFRGLSLNPQKDIPFVMNAKDPQFREMLQNAPVKEVGIFKGVYDEGTDEITHHEYIAADAVDMQTKQVMGNEAITVLG